MREARRPLPNARRSLVPSPYLRAAIEENRGAGRQRKPAKMSVSFR